MSSTMRTLAGKAALRTLAVLVAAALGWKWGLAPSLAVAPRPARTELAQPPPQAAGERPFAVRVAFAASEKWSGTVTAAGARVVEARGFQTSGADRVSAVAFDLEAADARPRAPRRKGFVLRGSATEAGRITIETGRGAVAAGIWELALGREVPYLDGRVHLERLVYAERLSDGTRDDDYPSIAVGPDGAAWAAWLSYGDGRDEIRVAKNGGAWRTFTPVPGTSGDVWRPQI